MVPVNQKVKEFVRPGQNRSDGVGEAQDLKCLASIAIRVRTLTSNGIRAHLARLQRDGLVRPGGSQAGTRKPHVIYTLTENAAHTFPSAYGLLLRELVGVLIANLNPRTVAASLRQVGRQLALEPTRFLRPAASDCSAKKATTALPFSNRRHGLRF